MAARRSKSARKTTTSRTRNVWLALLAAMTGVGGMLLVLDGRHAPAVQGLTLTPLAATGFTQSIESVFQTREPLRAGRWTHIMIHHSGSPVGSPASIEQEHVAQRLKGLGHHFVIGNGRGMEDGELHVGRRWLDQLPGAHAAGPKGEAYNLASISICLVGDGNRQRFTQAQIDRLAQLVVALQDQLGVPPENVVLHRDVADVADPGSQFPEAAFRSRLRPRR